MDSNKEIKKPIFIKDYGKTHCSMCFCNINGIGKANYCPHCGHAIDWNRRNKND